MNSARKGDFSMLKVWAGLEARKFLLASVDDVGLRIEEHRFEYTNCDAGRAVCPVRSAITEYLDSVFYSRLA